MKFGTIVHTYQMTDFRYDVRLSRWWLWCHFTQKSALAAAGECTCGIAAIARCPLHTPAIYSFWSIIHSYLFY